MKNLKFIALLFMTAFSFVAGAQTVTTESAFASQHGIFIKLETDYPVLKPGDYPSYKISRRKAGDKNFKTLATVQVPATYEAFLANLKEATGVNPEPLLMRQIPSEMLWNKFSKGGYDSLAVYRNALFLQLALGLKYYDATAEENTKYEYEVEKKEKEASSAFTTNAIAYPLSPVKYNLVYDRKLESGLNIKLYYSCKGEAPALVRVYREEQYSGKFMPIRANRIKTISKDTTFFTVSDTLVKANTVYRYFVLPMDYYGNYGIVSDTVTAISSAPEYAGNIQRMDVLSYSDGIAISWNLSNPQNFSSISVLRSTSFDSAFVKIGTAAATDTQYIDRTAEPMQIYFYAVQLLTRTGSTLPQSAKVTAMFTPKMKPLPPYLMDIQTNEKSVSITIKNNDPATRGYRIYRKTQSDSAYILLSDLITLQKEEMVYTDTMKLVKGNYYTYMVRAESKGYVLSDGSNQLKTRLIAREEIPSPGVPQVTLVRNGYLITWKALSLSNVSAYTLFRKDEKGNERILQENISKNILSYYDTTASGGSYKYGIRYSDDMGNQSPVAYTDLINPKSEKQYGPVNVYASNTPDALEISWKQSTDKNITAYRIYRIGENNSHQLLGEVTSGENKYIIKNAVAGQSYSLYVTTVNTQKEESLPGKTISLVRE